MRTSYLDKLYRRTGVTLYTLGEAAAGTPLSVGQLRECIRKGYVKGTWIGRSVCIERSELIRFSEQIHKHMTLKVN